MAATTGGLAFLNDGTYSMILPAGTYNVTAGKRHEYNDSTVTEIMVTDGYSTIQNFVLTLKPTGTITGTVVNT